MPTLERAIAIACEAHTGQIDKAGAPYILHPLRVMQNVVSTDEMIVAVLHDVVEDCPQWTFDRLISEGFSDVVLRGLDAVTKREGESYEDFVRRAAADPVGRAVKVADLRDNMDLTRIADPQERDFKRIDRYRAALAAIGADVP